MNRLPPGFPDCPYEALAHAGEAPRSEGLFKARPEDFEVTEQLPWRLSGEGEHVYLRVRKTGITTAEAIRRLAGAAGLRDRDIGRAGLKDRQGVCRQWLSLYLPGGGEPDLSAAESDALRIETVQRNHRKLRPGSHAGNHFRVLLRGLRVGEDELGARMRRIGERGVPNYFGEQRFGDGARNVARAGQMFRGEIRPRERFQRGMLISAARAWLFNGLLSARVSEDSWDRYRPGDVMNLAGSGSFFAAPQWDETLARRLAEGDIHPTGPLWGRGESPAGGEAAALEAELAERAPLLCRGLEGTSMKQQRRSLRLPVQALHYARPAPDSLRVEFTLPPGGYATAVLREICRYRGPAASDRSQSVSCNEEPSE